MTATPFITAADGALSMSDQRLFGPVACHLSSHEVITTGLLCDYQVVVMAERAGVGADATDLERLPVAQHLQDPRVQATSPCRPAGRVRGPQMTMAAGAPRPTGHMPQGRRSRLAAKHERELLLRPIGRS
ncbi:hypothetical protein [Nonomuraea sp. SBT364]|uniref:hypothetical protein n=1 Tax=Nonomuraea sp. SBT364 TaxID=1580530 RepID=UPI000AB21B91|nr:hypothetical protein [Nonomuraea sp. SBT364]